MKQEQKQEIENEVLETYAHEYSEKKFWEKLSHFSKKIGLQTSFYALALYYVMQKPEVSKYDKFLIVGYLGYLIMPLDLVPDIVPMMGYSDDMVGMLFALKRCFSYIDEDVKEKVKTCLSRWFIVDDAMLEEFLQKI